MSAAPARDHNVASAFAKASADRPLYARATLACIWIEHHALPLLALALAVALGWAGW